MAKPTREDRERAKALLVDIETWNEEGAEQLKKNGRKQAVNQLANIVAMNREKEKDMAETILRQMGPAATPKEAEINRGRAEMIAREMAQEELSRLY